MLSHIQGSPFLNTRVTAGDPAYAPNVIAWSQFGIGLSPQEPVDSAENVAGVPQHFLVQACCFIIKLDFYRYMVFT